MALLSKAERDRRLEYLGCKSVLEFQKMAFPDRKTEHDSKYGVNTDRALRHFYNVKKCAPSFKPTEFKCDCGRCNGYPSYMKQVELANLQSIRNHYGRPMIVTSGLRCRYANGSSTGSIQNSLHLVGRACDFYMEGVTDTLANRKRSIKWMMKLPKAHYCYGNGINSNGYAVSAPYMGNALHFDSNKGVLPVRKSPQTKICETAKKIADSHKYRYVYFAEKYGSECAICHPHDGKNPGWQCIGFVTHCWHSVIPKVRCRCDSITDQIYNRLLHVSLKEAKRIVAQRLGLSTDDIKIIRNGGKPIPLSRLQKGDWIAYYNGSGYVHTALYIGNGKIADCTSGRKVGIKYGVKSYTSMSIKFAIRYVGK